MRLRFLDTGPGKGAFNMGLDEALLEAVAEGRSGPVLRLYTWDPAAITIGYFQSAAAEVDLEAAREAGVDVLRRVTGGGAVFHASEITYSLVVPEGHALAPADILESYSRICGGLVEGLSLLGVEASFAPINDIVSGGKKISGNAQTRKRGCLLQHGTVLLDVDPERMFSLLKVPSEKLKGKLIQDVKARVSGLKGLLGREVGYAEAADALGRGFARAFGRLEAGAGGPGRAAGTGAQFPEPVAALPAELLPSVPSPEELERARLLAAEKYSTSLWTMRR